MIASEKKVYYKIYNILLLLHSLFKRYVLPYTFEEAKKLLEYDSKGESLKFHFFYIYF